AIARPGSAARHLPHHLRRPATPEPLPELPNRRIMAQAPTTPGTLWTAPKSVVGARHSPVYAGIDERLSRRDLREPEGETPSGHQQTLGSHAQLQNLTGDPVSQH